MSFVSRDEAQTWIVAKVAERLGITPEEVDVHKFWDEFGLESNEALMLAGEIENWLGIEIETTALFHQPTIADLSAFLAEEQQRHAGAS